MALFDFLPSDWKAFIQIEKYANLEKKIDEIYAEKGDQIFPIKTEVFRAFYLCPLNELKVIIRGQDPYFVPGQADGLAFSCKKSGVLQPSVRNIFKEVERSTGKDIKNYKLELGNLEPWAEQGVLLLNSSLTVESGRARSHMGLGWEDFTDDLIYRLLSVKKHLVLMRWGKDAEAMKLPPNAERDHLILTASHPSPYSYKISFEGCDHFKDCNTYLVKHGKEPICWT
jgi:uracil-DNA glycosylase